MLLYHNTGRCASPSRPSKLMSDLSQMTLTLWPMQLPHICGKVFNHTHLCSLNPHAIQQGWEPWAQTEDSETVLIQKYRTTQDTTKDTPTENDRSLPRANCCVRFFPWVRSIQCMMLVSQDWRFLAPSSQFVMFWPVRESRLICKCCILVYVTRMFQFWWWMLLWHTHGDR